MMTVAVLIFPVLIFSNFTPSDKQRIETDIQHDFDHALAGIKQLPRGVRKGVYMAYTYYLQLFNKNKQATATVILEDRIRIPDAIKLFCILRP